MDDSILNEIAAEIANRDCVLFTGAGLSMQGGGPSWTELITKTADHFDYDSPMLDTLNSGNTNTKFDNFDIFSAIVRENDRESVHEFVSVQLDDINLSEPEAKLAGFPWYASFTTNYDSSFEEQLRGRQKNRTVQRVLTDSDYPMAGLPANLLHVQLMGSIERGPNDTGSMVLTGDEKQKALDSRSGIFERLETHAANLSFLFVGYSFSDDIFTDVLRGITANLGNPENTFYALFRNPLSKSDEAFLKSRNVKPIYGDIRTFTIRLSSKVRARDIDDARVESIPIGREVIGLERNQVGDFLSSYNPVLNDRVSKNVGIKEFFKGETSSLRPFSKDWHFKREEEDQIVSTLVEDEADVITVSSTPGSGRTYLISAAVERLISEHGAIAFEIFNTDLSPIPDSEEFNRFINLIDSKMETLDSNLPKLAIFFSEDQLEKSELLQFHMLQEKSNIPLYCITECYDDYNPPKISGMNFLCVRPSNYIPSPRKDEFIEYLVDITSSQKLESLSEEQVKTYLNDSPEFFTVMYRAIYPTQQSIESIIDKEYNNLPTEKEEELVNLCSLCSALDVDIPVSVCRRYISNTMEEVSYKDVFDYANQGASSLISIRDDVQDIQYLSIYHQLIASYISNELGDGKLDDILNNIALSMKLKSRHEASFINELFIRKGVNEESDADAPFSKDGLQRAMETLRHTQPARPIIHHLGRLKSKRGESPDEFLPVLKLALKKPDEKYALEENTENVLTTIANELWEHKKHRLRSEPIDHPETQEIFDYIERARVTEKNLYSYAIQSRILLEMAQSQEGQNVVHRVNEAIKVIERGLSMKGDYEWKNRLRSRKVNLWKEINEGEAEAIAEELYKKHDRGDGYYTLAALEYYEKQNPHQALNRLDKAMDAERYPPQAPFLRLQILMEEQYDNYKSMLGYVKELERHPNFDKSWKSNYVCGIVYFINGNGETAKEYFTDAWQKAPRSERYGAEYFWNESGRRKEFKGIIGSDLTSSEGHLYEHRIDGWDEDIYFNPREQETEQELKPGMKVKFELGFSPRGPRGWDLEILE